MLAVIKVHNNEIGRCISVETQDEGESLIVELVKEKLGRDLTSNELSTIANDMEHFCEDDQDNQWAIGLAEIE